MNYITLALVTGAVTGLLDILVFYGDLPYLPWWADGSATVLMIAVPVMLCLVGKDRKAAPAIFMNAVILGFLISVSKHYLT